MQKLNVSANIQKGGRIIDLTEALRVLGLRPCEQAATGGLHLRQFPCRHAERLASMDCLRNRFRQTLGLRSGNRRFENSFRAAHLTKQFPSRARAKSRRQRKRQPSHALLGLYREVKHNTWLT